MVGGLGRQVSPGCTADDRSKSEGGEAAHAQTLAPPLKTGPNILASEPPGTILGPFYFSREGKTQIFYWDIEPRLAENP